MKAIVVKSFGGPEVMEYIDYKDPVPRNNQILVDTRMIGVNYADVHQVENSYLIQALPPIIPGVEASFLLEGELFVGITASGAYAEKVIVNKDRIFKVPEGVSEEEAISALCQGTTAYGIVNYMCGIKNGDLVLINGASSGVGMILIQLCKLVGATVIGVTSNQKKIDFIKNLGVDFACLNNMSDIKKIINSIGKKPNFIMESYGGNIFNSYYNILEVGGHICSYGSSSREKLQQIHLSDIIKDTKTVSGFWATKIFQDPNKLNVAINEMFSLIKNKKINIIIGEKMSLKDAKLMHQKIRNRDTLGKLILINNLGVNKNVS